MYFSGAGASGSRLENCVIEHANGSYNQASAIYIYYSSPTITGCTISNSSANYGIYINNGSPVISNNTINGFSSFGIYVDGSSPSVTGNTISGNTYGVNINSSSGGTYQGNIIMNNTSCGLYYTGSGVIDAIYNYWGDASGPLDNSDDRSIGGWYNPAGLGDRVSDKVTYYPWTIDYTDTDNDGISDDDDNCWLTPNPDQLDTDGDLIGDSCDNCPLSSNSEQQDTDNDGYGNKCDCDLDNNNFVGPSDFNIFKASWLTDPSKANWNPDADFDSDDFIGPKDFNIFKKYWLKSAPW